MQTIKVNEIFKSIQGEGTHSGELSIFVRLSGCNLNCSFCDTKHDTGMDMSYSEIIQKIDSLNTLDRCRIVITGGEPLLNPSLKEFWALLNRNYYNKVAVETNGNFLAWPLLSENVFIVCSPKGNSASDIIIDRIDCLKVLFPYQNGITAEAMTKRYVVSNVTDLYLQPITTGVLDRDIEAIPAAVNEIDRLKKEGFGNWKLSVQMHKYLDLQ